MNEREMKYLLRENFKAESKSEGWHIERLIDSWNHDLRMARSRILLDTLRY